MTSQLNSTSAQLPTPLFAPSESSGPSQESNDSKTSFEAILDGSTPAAVEQRQISEAPNQPALTPPSSGRAQTARPVRATNPQDKLDADSATISGVSGNIPAPIENESETPTEPSFVNGVVAVVTPPLIVPPTMAVFPPSIPIENAGGWIGPATAGAQPAKEIALESGAGSLPGFFNNAIQKPLLPSGAKTGWVISHKVGALMKSISAIPANTTSDVVNWAQLAQSQNAQTALQNPSVNLKDSRQPGVILPASIVASPFRAPQPESATLPSPGAFPITAASSPNLEGFDSKLGEASQSPVVIASVPTSVMSRPVPTAMVDASIPSWATAEIVSSTPAVPNLVASPTLLSSEQTVLSAVEAVPQGLPEGANPPAPIVAQTISSSTTDQKNGLGEVELSDVEPAESAKTVTAKADSSVPDLSAKPKVRVGEPQPNAITPDTAPLSSGAEGAIRQSASGTLDARTTKRMAFTPTHQTESAKPEEILSLTGKNGIVSEPSVELASTARSSSVADPFTDRFRSRPLSPEFLARVSAGQESSRSETEGALQASRPAMIGEHLWSAVDSFRATGRHDWDVRIKPDTGTELSLKLSVNGNQLQIVAKVDRGDMNAMASHWGELQTAFAARGIELKPLESSSGQNQGSQHKEPEANFLNTDSNGKRQPDFQGENQQETLDDGLAMLLGEKASRTMKRAPEPAPAKRSSSGILETWA